MTTAGTDSDIDSLEFLDFEADLPCDSNLDCDRSPEWKTFLSCCGTMFLLCTPCKEFHQKSMKEYGDDTKRTCGVCKNLFTPSSWTTYWEKL